MHEYEPEVDDYVIWERESWSGTFIDEGWVYFKAPVMEKKKGFTDNPRYITIETGVRDKHPEQMDGCTLHNNCLLYTSPSPRDRTRSRMPSSA